MSTVSVLYVEDDPPLRALMTEKLRLIERLRVTSVGGSSDALTALETGDFDVIMLDIALGSQSLSGIELAHQAKRMNSDIGVVFYSQYAETAHPKNGDDYFMGWSTISKSATVDIAHLADVLLASAQGYSHLEAQAPPTPKRLDVISLLTPRQQEIMGLTCQGFDANRIASTLGIAPITVRTDLSKIYRILLPNPEPGINLRTSAVLLYLRATRVDFLPS